MDFARTAVSLPSWLSLSQFRLAYKRLLLPVILIALLVAPITREVTVSTLSDAFWAVSSYVAFTLAIYHYLSVFMNKQSRVVDLYQNSRGYQVMFASILGALPGCGGAIIVTTQYVSGRAGFGALVAVLTSTMGDAAFLLLASQPETGFVVIALGVVVGCLSGWVVNLVHKDDFLRPEIKKVAPQVCQRKEGAKSSLETNAINLQGAFWKWLLVPATIVAVLGSFQVDVNELLQLPATSIEWTGALLSVTCMLLWALTQEIKDYESTVSEDAKCVSSHPIQKAAQDTNFVSAWVIVAFLAFELTTFFGQLDLANLFNGWGIWMPLSTLR